MAPPPKPPPELVHARDVAALLCSTLGWEKSEELVQTCAQQAGLDVTSLTREGAITILDALGGAQGIVGVTARFARTRIDTLVSARPHAAADAPQRPPPTTPSMSTSQTLPAVRAPAKRVPVGELVALLAASLGEEKALECLTLVLRERGFSTVDLSRIEATAAFDELARVPGIVGVTARFAKARLALRFA